AVQVRPGRGAGSAAPRAAAGAELAGDRVAAKAQARGRFGAAPAGVFQRRLEQGAVETFAGARMQVRGAGSQLFQGPGAKRAVPVDVGAFAGLEHAVQVRGGDG